MARPKEGEVNKSKAIREALAANKDKSPAEIAADLQKKGIDVNAQYVSTIKSNAKRKGGKKVVKNRVKFGRRVGNLTAGDAFNNGIVAAIDLIKAAGGLEKAKAALATVEKVQTALGGGGYDEIGNG